MSTDRNYYYVKWSAYAEINDERVDIAEFSITYQLDQIPKAVFFPVVGRDPRTGKAADALEMLLDAQPFSSVRIYVKGETEEDSPEAPSEPGFPYDEDVKIFEGYYQGVSYRSGRTIAGGAVTVGGEASGWLLGLLGTSAQTKVDTVKGPGGFAEIANVGNEKNINPHALFNVSSAFTVTGDKAVTDLWREFIKPLFVAMTEVESVWGDDDNQSAQEALDRMDDESAFEDNLTLSFGKVQGEVPKEILGGWLGANVARRTYDEWRKGSIWSALRAMASDFTFRIVPLIDTATCAPIFGALGGDAYIIIKPDEYHNAKMDFQTPELVTQLIVISDIAAIVAGFSKQGIKGVIVGQASAKDAWAGPGVYVKGKTIKIRAPMWLQTEPLIGEITRMSLGENKMAIPDAVNPDAFEIIPNKAKDYSEIYNNYLTSETGDAYAQTKLLDFMLQTRQGSIDGRFRLDISPGSTIAVEVVGAGKFMGGDAKPKHIFGLVDSVTLSMNSGMQGGTGTASTSFSMTNIRTGQEHTGYGGLLTEEAHPIYDTAFRGAKLWTE